jgi:DHA1 family inner membrane transport protein
VSVFDLKPDLPPHEEEEKRPPDSRPLRERIPAPMRGPAVWVRGQMGRVIPDDVWQNWCWDAVAGLCAGVYQGAIWTFALQLARGSLHATKFQMALATAAPAIGYLFATLWARQMEGRSKLPFVTITWFISRGLFLLTPFVVRGGVGREMFVSLIVMTPILFSVSTPAYTAIMKDIYPDRLRGRLMSLVRVGMAASMLVTARIMGFWQEHSGLDFRWMFFIGGIFGIGTAYAFSRLKLPKVLSSSTPPPIGRFLSQTFSILVHNKGYRWFTVSVFVSGFGNLVANTYYPIYQVDQFHITPTQIATMQNIAGALSLVSLFFWGGFMDRFGSLTTVLLACLIICCTPLLYAFSPNVTWLYLAGAANGVASSGIDIGYLNTTLMFAESGRAAQYQAVHSTFFGLRGTIAPLLAIPLLDALTSSARRRNPHLASLADSHFHDWKHAFLVCLAIMFLGAIFQCASMNSFRRNQKQDKAII